MCFQKRHNEVVAMLMESIRLSTAWFESNELAINNGKTEFINFSLNDNMVENRAVKLLGLYIDSKLTWKEQVEMLCRKASRIVFLIRKLKHCVSTEVLNYLFWLISLSGELRSNVVGK